MPIDLRSKKGKPSIKKGDKFDNKHCDDPVIVTMYGNYNNVTVEFSDGRKGFGSVMALKRGTIKPIGEIK
jgi:hypothetical protein